MTLPNSFSFAESFKTGKLVYKVFNDYEVGTETIFKESTRQCKHRVTYQRIKTLETDGKEGDLSLANPGVSSVWQATREIEDEEYIWTVDDKARTAQRLKKPKAPTFPNKNSSESKNSKASFSELNPPDSNVGDANPENTPEFFLSSLTTTLKPMIDSIKNGKPLNFFGKPCKKVDVPMGSVIYWEDLMLQSIITVSGDKSVQEIIEIDPKGKGEDSLFKVDPSYVIEELSQDNLLSQLQNILKQNPS